MRKQTRSEARRQSEERDLNRKSQRTGIPVNQLRKKKHASKKLNWVFSHVLFNRAWLFLSKYWNYFKEIVIIHLIFYFGGKNEDCYTKS